MEEEQRRLSIDSWWELFTLGREKIQPEDKYFQLLHAADDMERRQLITSDEWRGLIRRASACLCDRSDGFELIGMVKTKRVIGGARDGGSGENS